jgi:hypothetical protein
MDHDCRTDRRYLEIRVFCAQRAQLNGGIESDRLLPCIAYHSASAWARERNAEPTNFQIGNVHSRSWVIGSSTSAAQRSLGVVARGRHPHRIRTRVGRRWAVSTAVIPMFMART